MSRPYEAVWMTTQASCTPHAAALQAANPGLVIHVCFSPQGDTPETRRDCWRNCDRNIRNWWRANRDAVTASQVLFLEWDVFCDVDLAERIRPLGETQGLAGPRILSPLSDRAFWPFAEDLRKLPRDMDALACASAPLAVLLLSRAGLDAVLEARYDAIFQEDIFCETRLATVMRHAGFRVGGLDLPQVGCKPVIPTFPGVWHPVKLPVEALS